MSNRENAGGAAGGRGASGQGGVQGGEERVLGGPVVGVVGGVRGLPPAARGMRGMLGGLRPKTKFLFKMRLRATSLGARVGGRGTLRDIRGEMRVNRPRSTFWQIKIC